MQFNFNALAVLGTPRAGYSAIGCLRTVLPRLRYYSHVETAESVEPVETRPPLVDSFGRRHDYLRISLTERCNLRCTYCMPAEGVALSPRAELLSAAETLRLARVFAAAGVRKVRLTGGEPTVRTDLADVVRGLRTLGVREVALTTNGVALARRLPALQAAGLTALNVSLDSLRAERYARIARRPALARVLATVDLALQLGYRPVKINTVLVKGFNDDEIGDFVQFTRDRHVEVRFIEFMPFSGNSWEGAKLVPHRDAVRALRAAAPDARPAPFVPRDTAARWLLPGHAGTVAFISSMTRPFCAGCNRLRLTADGNLKVCLFGGDEVSLRDAARAGASDAELDALVRRALAAKKAQHAGKDSRRAPRRARLAPPPTRSASIRRHAELGARRRQPPDDTDRGLGAEEEGEAVLSHLDRAGRARMVDVGDKPESDRRAVAECAVTVSARLAALLRDARVPKGDAMGAARVAGVLAAKRAADLIPLCHSLPLAAAHVEVRVEDERSRVLVRCSVRTRARTGAEMEALTGCAVAALTLYDMCKAVDRDMRITDLRLVHKSGGRSSSAAAPCSPST